MSDRNMLLLSDKTVRSQLVDALTECGLIPELDTCSDEIVSHTQNDKDSEFWDYIINTFVVNWGLFQSTAPFHPRSIIERLEEWDRLYSNLSKNVKKEVFAYITDQHPARNEYRRDNTYISTVEDLLEFAAFYRDANKMGFVCCFFTGVDM